MKEPTPAQPPTLQAETRLESGFLCKVGFGQCLDPTHLHCVHCTFMFLNVFRVVCLFNLLRLNQMTKMCSTKHCTHAEVRHNVLYRMFSSVYISLFDYVFVGFQCPLWSRCWSPPLIVRCRRELQTSVLHSHVLPKVKENIHPPSDIMKKKIIGYFVSLCRITKLTNHSNNENYILYFTFKNNDVCQVHHILFANGVGFIFALALSPSLFQAFLSQ